MAGTPTAPGSLPALWGSGDNSHAANHVPGAVLRIILFNSHGSPIRVGEGLGTERTGDGYQVPQLERQSGSCSLGLNQGTYLNGRRARRFLGGFPTLRPGAQGTCKEGC